MRTNGVAEAKCERLPSEFVVVDGLVDFKINKNIGPSKTKGKRIGNEGRWLEFGNQILQRKSRLLLV